jgi:sulfite exporter TauE/SafE
VIELLLIFTLGFLGSFGHCIGMCAPLTVAFSLSQKQKSTASWQHSLIFHALLNLGRIASYGIVGAGIGALGSVLVAGGQIAGIGSSLRQFMTIFTGLLLIWFALVQLKPNFLPGLPVLHPLTQGSLRDRLNQQMLKLSMLPQWWTPVLLGLLWGLIPCGFLYAAQIKAAQTGNLWMGTATMLAFGLGTLPTMLGVGVSASRLSSDQRSQLFRLGGWVTLTIGVLTLLRTGDTMVDYTGHGALFCLMLVLIARPISSLWSPLLRYRRALGVGAFVLGIAHAIHMMQHTLNWNLKAFSFLLPLHQLGIALGVAALLLMIPAALTSFDNLQKSLGKRWRQIHLLTVPAWILSGIHTLLIGSHYFGGLKWSWENQVRAVILGVVMLGVLLIRRRFVWSLLSLEKFYASPGK